MQRDAGRVAKVCWEYGLCAKILAYEMLAEQFFVSARLCDSKRPIRILQARPVRYAESGAREQRLLKFIAHFTRCFAHGSASYLYGASWWISCCREHVFVRHDELSSIVPGFRRNAARWMGRTNSYIQCSTIILTRLHPSRDLVKVQGRRPTCKAGASFFTSRRRSQQRWAWINMASRISRERIAGHLSE